MTKHERVMEAIAGKPELPCDHSREPQSAEGASRTRHLNHLVNTSHIANTGDPMKDAKEGGK